jgi:hypothetical protein
MRIGDFILVMRPAHALPSCLSINTTHTMLVTLKHRFRLVHVHNTRRTQPVLYVFLGLTRSSSSLVTRRATAATVTALDVDFT